MPAQVICDTWLLPGGVRLPYDAHTHRSIYRYEPQRLFGTAGRRRVWSAGLLGALRCALSTKEHMRTTDAGLCYPGLHLVTPASEPERIEASERVGALPWLQLPSAPARAELALASSARAAPPRAAVRCGRCGDELSDLVAAPTDGDDLTCDGSCGATLTAPHYSCERCDWDCCEPCAVPPGTSDAARDERMAPAAASEEAPAAVVEAEAMEAVENTVVEGLAAGEADAPQDVEAAEGSEARAAEGLAAGGADAPQEAEEAEGSEARAAEGLAAGGAEAPQDVEAEAAAEAAVDETTGAEAEEAVPAAAAPGIEAPPPSETSVAGPDVAAPCAEPAEEEERREGGEEWRAEGAVNGGTPGLAACVPSATLAPPDCSVEEVAVPSSLPPEATVEVRWPRGSAQVLRLSVPPRSLPGTTFKVIFAQRRRDDERAAGDGDGPDGAFFARLANLQLSEVVYVFDPCSRSLCDGLEVTDELARGGEFNVFFPTTVQHPAGAEASRVRLTHPTSGVGFEVSLPAVDPPASVKHELPLHLTPAAPPTPPTAAEPPASPTPPPEPPRQLSSAELPSPPPPGPLGEGAPPPPGVAVPLAFASDGGPGPGLDGPGPEQGSDEVVDVVETSAPSIGVSVTLLQLGMMCAEGLLETRRGASTQRAAMGRAAYHGFAMRSHEASKLLPLPKPALTLAQRRRLVEKHALARKHADAGQNDSTADADAGDGKKQRLLPAERALCDFEATPSSDAPRVGERKGQVGMVVRAMGLAGGGQKTRQEIVDAVAEETGADKSSPSWATRYKSITTLLGRKNHGYPWREVGERSGIYELWAGDDGDGADAGGVDTGGADTSVGADAVGADPVGTDPVGTDAGGTDAGGTDAGGGGAAKSDTAPADRDSKDESDVNGGVGGGEEDVVGLPDADELLTTERAILLSFVATAKGKPRKQISASRDDIVAFVTERAAPYMQNPSGVNRNRVVQQLGRREMQWEKDEPELGWYRLSGKLDPPPAPWEMKLATSKAAPSSVAASPRPKASPAKRARAEPAESAPAEQGGEEEGGEEGGEEGAGEGEEADDTSSDDEGVEVYLAKTNDTPRIIAAEKGVDLKALLVLNARRRHLRGLKVNSKLWEGTKLRLPPPLEQQETKRQRTAAEMAADAAAEEVEEEVLEEVDGLQLFLTTKQQGQRKYRYVSKFRDGRSGALKFKVNDHAHLGIFDTALDAALAYAKDWQLAEQTAIDAAAGASPGGRVGGRSSRATKKMYKPQCTLNDLVSAQSTLPCNGRPARPQPATCRPAPATATNRGREGHDPAAPPRG